MLTADYNVDDFANAQQRKMDEGLLVRFYPKAMPDNAQTMKQGKPCFKDVDIIEIRVPGQKNFVARPCREKDIMRFPRHWEAYQTRTKNDPLIEGTLLTEWPLVTRSQVEELAFSNVKTVEQLAAMPDSNASQFMGMNNLKQKAIEWLKRAAKGAEAEKLEQELAKRDAEIAELKAAVKTLSKPKAKRKRKKATAKKD